MIFFYIFFLSFFLSALLIQDKSKFRPLSPLLLVNILILVLYLFVDEITGSGFTRSFWYHLNFNLNSGTYAPYFLVFILDIFLLILTILLGYFLSLKINLLKNNFNHKLSIILLILNPAFFSIILSYVEWKNFYNTNNDELEISNYYYDLEDLDKKFEKRDLIFISLESFERTYYGKKLSKKIELDLLNRKDTYDFTNIKQIKDYTDWTIAGLVAANCGKPITYVDNSNSLDFFNSFSPNSICLSDYLDYQNYDQFLIQGSSLKFAGNGNFYKLHNVLNQFGKNEIQKIFKNKNLEISHWGVHDNHVLEFAEQKIFELENIGKPYAIWLNTLDNHAPSGLLSNLCKKITPFIKNQMLKIAKCTDIFVNNFINKIYEQDLNKNNLIVIHSDHLLMNSFFQKNFFDDENERRNLFLIIDPYKIDKKKFFEASGNHFDIPATILDYLYNKNKIGLGKSLMKNKFTSNDLDYSISPDFNDFKIIKKYEKEIVKKEKNLFNYSFNLDFKNESLVFQNGLNIKLPLIKTSNNIYLSTEDVDGNSKERLHDIIVKHKNDIITNNELDIIAKCSEINIFFDLMKKCEFGLLKIIKGNDYTLKFYNINDEDIYYLENINIKSSSNKDINFIKDKIKKFEKLQPNNSLKYLVKKIKLSIKNVNPNFYTYVRNLFREIKYLYIKLRLNNFSQLIFNSNKYSIKYENFIAHAGGTINNHKYTNSLEAINFNYKKGVKLFEFDLNLTSDNQLVAVHDWESWQNMTDYKKKIPPNKKDFINTKILKKYTPLDLDKIINWHNSHEDTIIFTDKFDDLKTLLKSFPKNENFYHEIYDEKQLIYAFDNDIKNIIVSEKILRNNFFSDIFLKKLKDHNIYGLSVSRYSIYKNSEFFKKARLLGLKVFVYRLNDGYPGGTEKELICNFNEYLDAVYADYFPKFGTDKSINYCN
jgi:phosphoglycerol transferase